jgi:hypothetical protein
LLGPRLRLLWTALICGLHLTITLLCTMPYLEPCALLVLLAVPWPAGWGVKAPARTHAETAHEGPPRALERPRLPVAMAVALACVVLFAWAVAPFGWRGH